MANPYIAVILNLIIVGLGQMYAGAVLRGIGMFFGYGVAAVIMITMTSYGIALLPILWLVIAYDAYELAS